MPLSKSEILDLPGVSALVVASQAKVSGMTFAELASMPGNEEPVKMAARKYKKLDVWSRYCRAYLALRDLSEALPSEGSSLVEEL